MLNGMDLDTNVYNLEAKAEIEVPPRTMADVVSAANQLAASLLPGKTVALTLSDRDTMRRLNHSYRGIDEATDVLSFPPGIDPRGRHAGDIAVCWPVATEQAATHGHSPVAETVALIAHGLLHLAGWDHPDAEAQAEMDARTIAMCKSVGYEVQLFGH
jgi:probable rRNA maturation factor